MRGLASVWFGVLVLVTATAAVAREPIAALPAAALDVAPWVIAHRGASSDAPENTMAAFRQAIRDGADAIELDCQATADGHLVVLHDDTLDRTTNGHGPVGKLTLAQVRQLDAGSWKGKRFAGEPIPTFEEVVRLARDSHVGIVPEAKTPYVLAPGLAGQIVDALDREGMTAAAIVQSFDHRPLSELHARRPDVKLGPLVDAGIDDIEGVLRGAGAYSYLPCFAYMLPDRVARIHELGYKVCVWTVDLPQYMLMITRTGVDGIMTNKTRVLRQLLDGLHLKRRPWPAAAAWGKR